MLGRWGEHMNDLKLVRIRTIVYGIMAFMGAMLVGMKLRNIEGFSIRYVTYIAIEIVWCLAFYKEREKYKTLKANEN